MPFVTVKLIEGRTDEQKRRLVAGVTTAVAEACGIPEKRVHVFLEDLARDAYAKGGVFVSDMPSVKDQ